MHQHFIGYGTLEEFAQAASMLKTVYVNSITQPGKTSTRGLRNDRLIVIVSQLDADGNVHYVRLPTGYLASLNGLPLERNTADERLARQVALYQLVRDWLAEHGFSIREAVIAAPTSLTYLDGWAEFVQYDETAKTFVRKGAQ